MATPPSRIAEAATIDALMGDVHVPNGAVALTAFTAVHLAP
jgi:hypothetical protein